AVGGVVEGVAVVHRALGDRLGGLDGIVQQDRDGHRADAAGDRGDRLGVLDFVELDVADQLLLAVLAHDAGDAYVDHHGAGLDPVPLDQFGRAGGGDDDVGLAGDLGQVLGVDVRDRHGAFTVEQKHGDGLADDVRLAD